MIYSPQNAILIYHKLKGEMAIWWHVDVCLSMIMISSYT